MKPYDFVHLVFWALGGEVSGKTKLQKTVYFLGLLTDNLNDLGFRAHYYGPYSDEVSHAVDSLKTMKFVAHTTVFMGAHDTRGFEVSRQDFKLTDEGRTIAERKTRQFPDEWRRIEQAAGVFRRAGELDYMKMSIAAKTHFLQKTNQAASVEELSEKAKELGWNPTRDEIAESMGFLKKLGLAK